MVQGTTTATTTVLDFVGIVRVRVVLGSEEPDAREVAIKEIHETLYAALADVLASAPHLHMRPGACVRRQPSRSGKSAAPRHLTPVPAAAVGARGRGQRLGTAAGSGTRRESRRRSAKQANALALGMVRLPQSRGA